MFGVLSVPTGDAVHMRSETKRQEYVLAQHGQIYRGTHKRIKGTPWNFGQVQKMSIADRLRKSYAII